MSHVTILLPNYFFLTFDGSIITLCNSNVTCDNSFAKLLFPHIWWFHPHIVQFQHHMWQFSCHIQWFLYFFSHIWQFYPYIVQYQHHFWSYFCHIWWYPNFFFSYLIISSSHWIVLISHITVFLSHSMVFFFLFTFDSSIVKFSLTNITYRQTQPNPTKLSNNQRIYIIKILIKSLKFWNTLKNTKFTKTHSNN